MKFVSCLFTLFAVCTGESYWQLQLSPESIGSVPFGSSHISVWEHATWKGRYFAMPLVCLQSDTAQVMENIFSRRIELEFSVLLWSREARETVSNFLRTHVNASIVEEQVELLPMEKIRLVWRGPPLPDFYQLADQWRSNTHLPTVVTFSVTCQNRQRCQELQDAVKTRPEMEYEINSQRSARRRLTVEGRHLVGGSLYASLERMPVSSPIRYLRSEDVKRLATETLTNVISSQVTDADYVDTDDEISMSELLQRVFDQTQVSTTDFQPHMWTSLFWDPENARPDRITSYMNKVISKNGTNSSSLSIDQSQRSRSAEAGFGFLGLFRTGGAGGSSSRSSVQKGNLLQSLRERDTAVQWTGERFIPKPVQLSRLNLATLNTSTSIVSSSVQIKRHDSVQRIKLRVSCDNNQTSMLTPELVKARVQTFNRTESEHNKAGALDTRLQKLETAEQTRIKFEALSTILSDRRSLSLQGYCYLPDHYCEHRPASSVYHDRTTLQALKTLCDQDVSCKAFNDYTRADDGGGRTYRDFCPTGQFSNSSREHYYIKIASTWGTVISERLSNIVQSTPNHNHSTYLDFLSLYDHGEYCKQFGDDFRYER